MELNTLESVRVYLSGPMDFVGSRIIEKYLGWRAILTPVLRALGMTVLDPWNKPTIRGHDNYGQEGVIHSKSEYEKDFWTNKETRARFETDFWETVHIDLRMTDISDFIMAFVPTNIYSVGTVHEIVTARLQLKPALLISPPVNYDLFPEIKNLPDSAKKALKFYGLKENPHGIPSQWYGNIVGGHYMFDGFGWENLNFKDKDFYPKLIENVINTSKPADEDQDEMKRWQDVKKWASEYKPFESLSGGVLDNIKVKENEKDLLERALNNPVEQQRKYFWYNTPYTPKRPALYQLFSIASGYIPPRLHIIRHLDNEGNVSYQRVESVDDCWLLIAPKDKKKS